MSSTGWAATWWIACQHRGGDYKREAMFLSCSWCYTGEGTTRGRQCFFLAGMRQYFFTVVGVTMQASISTECYTGEGIASVRPCFFPAGMRPCFFPAGVRQCFFPAGVRRCFFPAAGVTMQTSCNAECNSGEGIESGRQCFFPAVGVTMQTSCNPDANRGGDCKCETMFLSCSCC